MTWICDRHGVQVTLGADGRRLIGLAPVRRSGGHALHPLFGLAGCALPMALPRVLRAATGREIDLPVINPDWSATGAVCHVRRVD